MRLDRDGRDVTDLPGLWDESDCETDDESKGKQVTRCEIECEFDCPHCGQGFTMNDSGIYTDDVEDECESQCSSCGGLYQLRCVSVQVEMEAIPITKDESSLKG